MCSSIVYILSVDRFNSEQDRSLLRFLTETAVPLLASEAHEQTTGASAGDDPFDFSASVDEDEAPAADSLRAAAAAATRQRPRSPNPEELQAAGRLHQLLAHETHFAEFCNIYDSIDQITVRFYRLFELISIIQ